VNSFAWLEAQRSGTTAAFLRDQDVGYTVNHAQLGEDGEDAGIRSDVARLWDEEVSDGIRQVHREEFTYRGRIEGSGNVGDRWAVFVYELPTS
jgi:hypothetical protein